MRFTVTRLCGGRALMMIPREDIRIDIELAAERLQDFTEEVRTDGAMVICNWRGMEMTVYEPGKVMLFPLKERLEGIKYAKEVLERLSDCRI